MDEKDKIVIANACKNFLYRNGFLLPTNESSVSSRIRRYQRIKKIYFDDIKSDNVKFVL